jgi:hypothetical protein
MVDENNSANVMLQPAIGGYNASEKVHGARLHSPDGGCQLVKGIVTDIFLGAVLSLTLPWVCCPFIGM